MVRTAAALRSTGLEAEGQLGDVLRVLADPTRLRVFCLLRQGEGCVCEIAAQLDLAENLVSHHLRALREIGLVHDRRDPSDARWVYYHLSMPALGRIRAELGVLFDPFTLGVRTPTCGPAAANQVGMGGVERAPETCCTR
jgi:ArsR family transcriptional regulator